MHPKALQKRFTKLGVYINNRAKVPLLLPAFPVRREWRGLFVWRRDVTRVAVFIDYENLRLAAREVFGDPKNDPYTFGHVNPHRLGVLLTELGKPVDAARVLTAVNVYRGRMGPKSGPKVQAGSARQFASWVSQPFVTVNWSAHASSKASSLRTLQRSGTNMDRDPTCAIASSSSTSTVSSGARP